MRLRGGANGHLSEWVSNLFPQEYMGYAIDVGASDGVSINSTWLLEKRHGWTVICVEANPEFYESLDQLRPWVEKCAVSYKAAESADFHVHTRNPESFSSLNPVKEGFITIPGRVGKVDLRDIEYDTITVPVMTLDQIIDKWQMPKVDAVFVDVEGGELDVLRGFDIARWRPKAIITECWDTSSPIDIYLSALRYRKSARNVHNDLFVRID